MSHFSHINSVAVSLSEQSRGSLTFRRPWKSPLWKLPSPRLQMCIKWSVKRLFLTAWNAPVKSPLSQWVEKLRSFAEHFCGWQKTKTRDLKMSWGFWKRLLLFVLFQLSASITFCTWSEACSVPPRQDEHLQDWSSCFTRKQTSQLIVHCVGQMLNCLLGWSDLSDHWSRPLSYSVHHTDVFDSVTSG